MHPIFISYRRDDGPEPSRISFRASQKYFGMNQRFGVYGSYRIKKK